MALMNFSAGAPCCLRAACTPDWHDVGFPVVTLGAALWRRRLGRGAAGGFSQAALAPWAVGCGVEPWQESLRSVLAFGTNCEPALIQSFTPEACVELLL